MDLAEIDSRLQRYTAAEHRIGANLQELEQHSVYQLLSTDDLEGATRRAFAASKGADPSLWELFTLLSVTLERARGLRGTGSRIDAQVRHELEGLLSGSAVLISTRSVPLGERDLTGAASSDDRITIEELIERMRLLYEPLRDVVTHAERVLRAVLPRLNAAEGTLGRLRDESKKLGLDTIELDRVDETIARIRDLSLTDPLSIPADTDRTFDDAIHRVSARVATARSSHDSLTADIASTSELLDDCRELIERASLARIEATAKISQPIGLRQPPSVQAVDGPKGLAAQLEPILASTSGWQAIRRELDAWIARASALRDQLSRVAEANEAPLHRRDELRGRLDAFRAKMAGTGHGEDPVLRELSAEAHNELYTSPTDLARAERLVTEFGARIGRT